MRIARKSSVLERAFRFVADESPMASDSSNCTASSNRSEVRGQQQLCNDFLLNGQRSYMLQYNLARSFSSISLVFVVVVTPWTFKEVIKVTTDAKVNRATSYRRTSKCNDKKLCSKGKVSL